MLKRSFFIRGCGNQYLVSLVCISAMSLHKIRAHQDQSAMLFSTFAGPKVNLTRKHVIFVNCTTDIKVF
jgi:hypothetical protein